MSVSDKIVQLRIATRKAAMCESTDSVKNTLSLKTKILFLIRNRGLSPGDIMDALMIVKTNLALITGEMAKQGLLVKEKKSGDKREIIYAITSKGTEYLERRLEIIEQSAQRAFSDEGEYTNAENKLEEALSVFGFML